MRRLTGMAGCVVLVLVLCSQTHARVFPELFSVNAHVVLWLPAEAREMHLAAMRAARVSMVRTVASWRAVEPVAPTGAQHHYRWDFHDRWVGDLARHGLRWQPTVHESAPWAATSPGNWRSAPTDGAAFAAVTGALAARYGHGGQFWSEHPELPYLPVLLWEIWNEPNAPMFWLPQPEPDRYAELLAQAAGAVKAVDRQAHVLFGSMLSTHRPEWFVTEALRVRPDLPALVDGVAWHPYGYDDVNVVQQTRHFRRALDRTGLAGVPLHITEFGWASSVPGAWPEPTRAKMMWRLAARLPRSDCKVRSIAPYSWLDAREGYGVATHSGALMPAGAAYARGLAHSAAHGDSRVALCYPGRPRAR